MDERSGINQEIEQRTALFEAVNRDFKKRFPDLFYNPLFPISQGSYIWVKDNSGLYGNLETTYQLGELSLVDLGSFLQNGALTKKLGLKSVLILDIENGLNPTSESGIAIFKIPV